VFKYIIAILSISVLVFINADIYAQNCENIGFDNGTFDGWVLVNGDYSSASAKPVYGAEVIGTKNNEHLITSAASGNDPNVTAEAISQVAPGSTYSCRIGYVIDGNRYDRLKKTFVVTPDNSLFQFSYAIVLEQDSKHQDFEKPGFSVKIVDKNGNPLKCSTYDIQLQPNTVANGFKTQAITNNRQVQYRNWTTAAMDLRDYVGQSLTIVVEVHGCTGREHFGYAYFDARCFKSEIVALSNCPDENGLIPLKAPDGFARYTWNNGETGQIAKAKATLGANYSAQLLPFSSLDNGCEFSLDYKIKYTKTTAIINKTLCEGGQFMIANTSYKIPGTYTQTISRTDVCDSVVTLNLKVVAIPRVAQSLTICEGDSVVVGKSVYKKDGVFTNVFNRKVPNDTIACDSVVTTTIVVEKTFKVILPARFETNEGQKVQLVANVTPAGNYIYVWSPPNALSCVNCASPWASPTEPQNYTLTVSNANNRCPVTYKTKVAFMTNWLIAPSVFTPNGDKNNDVFFVYGNANVTIVNELLIFNRWGILIFKNNNFPTSNPTYGWDGTAFGHPALADTYVYKITYTLESGDVSQTLGKIVLMR
jgi:gliding motility-associated-like protein